MQKALVFFVAVLLLILIITIKPTEGFVNFMGVNWNDMNKGTPPALYTDLPIKQPQVVQLAEAGVGNIQPSPPSASDLPSAPAPQRSKETPSPYKNPTMEPAKYIQLLGVKEDLQAFFGFQAFMLESSSDPAIQIPLTRARADMAELINVASVMERNPGVPSRLTMKQIDDIRANLQYLRDILHDLESSGAVSPQEAAVKEGFADASSSTEPSKRATLKEIQTFQVKVVVEIKRLEASGTSDPVLTERINTLNRIKNEMDDVIMKIESGFYKPEDVPIYASDIEAALPLLGNPSDPLPTLLKKTGLPPAIQNLFPGGLSPSDTEQATQINNIVKGYMNNLVQGASWGVDVSLKYDNPEILKLKAMAAAAQPTLGLPGVPTPSNQQITGVDATDGIQAKYTTNTANTSSSYETGLPGISLNRILPEPVSGSLDWKQRSSQIREQIRRRGLSPADFGVLPEGAEVSPEFSWRGYTQMICSRLNTTPDTGLAVSVGCPPQEWEGWKV